jgi:transcriptional regulator GlxA family with amidase domain
VTLVDYDFHSLPPIDYLFLVSGVDVKNAATSDLIALLRRQHAHGTRLAALCSGTYILAMAGLLDNIRAAIHWEFHDSFMEEFPQVRLSRNVFVADERIVTASGGSATADLMLHLVEMQHGPELATEVADQMVYNAVRGSTGEQRVSMQARHGIRNAHLTRAIHIMVDAIDEPLSLSDITEELGISRRQLERLFGRYLNCSPKKYLMDLRLQRARKLLIQTDDSITTIAMMCGFDSPAHLSRAYRTHFGVSPSAQRSKIE